MNIVDQQTDRSQAVFCQAVDRLTDKDFAKKAADMVSDVQTKTAAARVYADSLSNQFPVGTVEDAVVSKLYFDFQREKIADHRAQTIGEKLDTYLNLHDVPESLFEYTVEKQAARTGIDPRYLLPSLNLCKVASHTDLDKAADLFTRENKKLTVSQRVEFSTNYIKTASELDVDNYPVDIAKYAGTLDTDMQNVKAILEVKAAAATRCGMSGQEYIKLAFDLSQVEVPPTKEELTKLADTIYHLDEAHGFNAPKYDRKMPDAYATVFNKEAQVEDDVAPMITKAEIIARYGEDALEAVEDEDGNIDVDRLRRIKGIGNDEV